MSSNTKQLDDYINEWGRKPQGVLGILWSNPKYRWPLLKLRRFKRIDMEDVQQSAILYLYKNWDSYLENPGVFLAWVRQLVFFSCLATLGRYDEERRNANKYRSRIDERKYHYWDKTPVVDIDDYLKHASPHAQKIIRDHYFNGMSITDIGIKYGYRNPVKYTSQNMHRGLAAIRKAVTS